MIEVEKKILLRVQDVQAIEKQAAFLKEKKFTDTYFDTADFQLTKRDVWLRLRGARFELKVGLKQATGFDRYQEIDTEPEIAAYLKIDLPLQPSLAAVAIVPFCTMHTHRKTYRFNDCTLDLDLASCQGLEYRVAEIEKIVEREAEMKEAEREILACLTELGIDPTAKPPAKLSYFLSQTAPAHYQELVRKNIIR